jgi:hypothetical protein
MRNVGLHFEQCTALQRNICQSNCANAYLVRGSRVLIRDKGDRLPDSAGWIRAYQVNQSVLSSLLAQRNEYLSVVEAQRSKHGDKIHDKLEPSAQTSSRLTRCI